ncbi:MULTISPECIES: UDP-glucose 4-epimerase GalE [unclassified Rubrivivax]|uniref:UDP-glucose 4-epimerase GalE n=1 Tax=unclassified Rubrivivax TaxID=2649762 RepID=UPI001E5E1DE9|nr:MULTISPECIES: UDP-glucose 4-epimerase GalE [unclassified Rubrivivax]MCC9598809.1 UDP-glucose 4-epimerase GalE [Rubrivivax sp. JA1055]MCC9648509.1 UDP-glucose 4-epimerase GalE [Rubrivivax sp. JA1029]
MATILLTGATGYIASHTWLALQAAGFEVVGVDDFSNSSPVVLERLHELGGRPPVFERADVCDAAAMEGVFQRHRIDATVHFAAFKAVGESTAKPLEYYANNLGGLLNVCRTMRRHGCARFVFSSSATVYGDPDSLPIREDARLTATNPYGQTKLVGEQILRDLGAADPAWQTACLRYFNPVGAHESGRIGEDPRGTPNNLMPYVTQVAVGRREFLQVFGDDYPTPDGTGVRDYIHVCDLADGHVAALRRLLDAPGSFTVNLGTGRGHSVLEVVTAFARASGRPVPYRIVPRRPGDVAACWADPSQAQSLLGWQARHGLERMCTDSWRWQQNNPRGFEA